MASFQSALKVSQRLATRRWQSTLVEEVSVQKTALENAETEISTQHHLSNTNNHGLPYSGSLEQLAELTNEQLDAVLNEAPTPTGKRDEIVLEKFHSLLKTYGNRDKLRKQFNSSSSLLAKFPNLVPSEPSEPYSEAELVIRQRHHSEIMGKLGSEIVGVYKPHTLISNPPKAKDVTIKKLMAAGAHLGRSTKLYNHNSQPFIYGEYKDIHIIDLEKTIELLRSASKVVQGVVENGGLVLFLGLQVGQLKAIKQAAERCNGYYVARKWVPGAITNSLQNPKPRHEVDMADLPTNRELSSDETNKIIKPDLIVVLNPEISRVAIKEANQARIPTIGIVDTNVNPNIVTYPIPANSSSGRTINLITGVLGKAGEIGLQRRLQKVNEYKERLGMDSADVFGTL